jgi:hypothetical protein
VRDAKQEAELLQSKLTRQAAALGLPPADRCALREASGQLHIGHKPAVNELCRYQPCGRS